MVAAAVAAGVVVVNPVPVPILSCLTSLLFGFRDCL